MEYKPVYSSDEQLIISEEFSRTKDHFYMDHAGTTLYSEKQLTQVFSDLSQNLFSNPHTSKHTGDCIDQIRYRVLQHFNTNANEYTVIFTSGTTAALKLVAESFNFKTSETGNDKNGTFCYLKESHTSLVGLREIAANKSAEIECVTHNQFFDILKKDETTPKDNKDKTNSLFAYPAQCNFSGFKYPLSMIKKIQNGAINDSNWFVLLDAASFVSTSFLDLSKYKPDFVCFSFYKIFGYPTGLGALLVKNESSWILSDRKYFGGGTVKILLSETGFHKMRDNLHERFEDGTLPFLSILSLRHGFDTMQRLVPETEIKTIERIRQHAFQLARYIFFHLSCMHHQNGKPVTKIYGETNYDNPDTQGPIINFNILHDNEDYVGFAEINHMANLHNITLRTGCFCNTGSCQRYLKITDEVMKIQYEAGHICGDENDLIDGIPTGSVRVSLGYMSSKKEADVLINMIKSCYVQGVPIYQIPLWWQDVPKDIQISNTFKKMITDNYKEETSVLVNDNYNIGNDTDTNSDFQLLGICVYPIKSCGADRVSEWAINSKGLQYDREWMIVTGAGVALTQKQDTRMCLVRPKIDLEHNKLNLSFPDMEDISVPLLLTEGELRNDLSLCQSKVCGDRIEGIDCGDDVAHWLSEALEKPGLRLLRQSTTQKRVFRQKIKDEVEQPEIGLANQAQFLLINQTSVQWLADKIESEFDENIDAFVARFRGNLIISTKKPLDENNWKNVRIGDVNFKVEGPCTRCQMICIDQYTAVKTPEPLKTIAKVFQGKMRFGVYLSQCKDNPTNAVLKCGNNITA